VTLRQLFVPAAALDVRLIPDWPIRGVTETAEEAVVREVMEETGLHFDKPLFLYFFNELFPEHNFHAVALAFYGKGVGTVELMPDEVEQIAWFPLHEALALPLAFNHNQIVQRYATQLAQ
jgi:8-oxo-dGTP diphosphatase